MTVRVLRVIARMNMGGPAYHVSLLSGRLDPTRYETLLLAGAVGPGEASLDDLAQRYGARLEHVATLGPELHPLRDARALLALIGHVRRLRPQLVHTHTAKAGILGRFAALTVRPRPVIVHTYHGHVLSGYFGPLKTAVFRGLERLLGRVSDCLIGVSEATVSELVALRVAPREKFRVVRLGLELDGFHALGPGGAGAFRDELGLAPGEILAVFVGRLVPIKRVDLALEALAHARRAGAAVHLAVVGDGELRGALEGRARELGVAGAVSFVGYRRDLEAIAAATDIALLSSDNEGTPVALIEASAAGRPVVSTAAGGVAEVVEQGETGLIVPCGDAAALGAALARLAGDAGERARMGANGRERSRRFSVLRLLEDVDRLYGELLETARVRV